ncbi:MAG: NUDIX domain-containing protein [Deltaproteobacteria bacterium]|nr:NUDIX domain-containing protein [Deltaproteobacteria bacterium]
MKNAHCSHCGAAFVVDAAWPRTCAACGETSYVNPIPVAVLLLPVDDGVLAIRRGVAPQIGKLALPGGYVDFGESFEKAGARELFEETQISVSPDDIKLFSVGAGGSTLIIFGVGPRFASAALPPFVATSETTERVLVSGPVELAFPLHTEALARFFAERTL